MLQADRDNRMLVSFGLGRFFHRWYMDSMKAFWNEKEEDMS
jgi:hypothetical protein